jgi:ABC-type multidrug transport system fused ATPase/permease subunit
MVATSNTAPDGQLTTANEPPEREWKRSRFLRTYLWANRSGLVLVIGCGLISSVSSFLLTLIIGDFFLLQFQTGSSKGKLLMWMGLHLTTVSAFFRAFVVLLVVKFISNYLERYLASRQGECLVKDIRHTLFKAQMYSPVSQFQEGAFGNYLLRYSNDLKSVQLLLVKGVLGGIKQFFFTVMGLILLYRINPGIGLLCTGFVFLIILLMYFLSAGQKQFIRESRRRRSNLLAFVTRSFSRFEKLRSGGREEEFLEKFQRRSDLLFTANLHNNRADSFLNAAAYTLQFGMIGTILWLMNSQAVQFIPGDGLLVVLLLLLMQGAVRGLLKIPAYLNKGSISLHKIEELVSGARPN